MLIFGTFSLMSTFNKYGVEIPQILLPKKGSDYKAWSVIACDQYTQDRDYWARCEKNAEGKPSCINLILPEVYLNDADKAERIEKIHKNMVDYVDNGVFASEESEFVYIERTTAYGRVRKGLIVAIDLETYEWKPFSKALIRATEATIVDRIPPRMEIRRGAPLESPHIMLLVNDADKELVEKSGEIAKTSAPIYETELMENSGSIKGYAIKDGAALDSVKAALEKLYAKNTSADGSVFMFAVGDGNHSLATAKEFYEQLKRENPDKDLSNHPARYALVEIVNLHSPALEFEAIHRIVTDIDRNKLLDDLTDSLKLSEKKSEQKIQIVLDGVAKDMYIHAPSSKLTVGSLQNFIDGYLQKNDGKVDYIHGIDVINQLSMDKNSVGFILPDMGKEELFPTVICDGALPRKTFSMGHAEDKRFYIEARKITE